jgi:NAD(P)-dependent dehydrogenase (short-subunit alcohol dehydrogenase family)
LTIRFREEHLHKFRDASWDVNPLHLSEAYAWKTPFGERVVYGVLGLTACLGQIKPPAGRVPSAVRIDFKAALALNVDYTLQVKWEPSGHLRASLMDGSAAAMRIHLQFRDGAPELADLPDSGTAPRDSARQLSHQDLRPGIAFQGRYSPGRAEYQALLDLCPFDRRAWGDALPLAVLCTSYLTGMELPGESASYSGLRAEILSSPAALPFDFEVALESLDDTFGLLQSRFTLHGNAGVWAQGEISAIARAPIARRHAIAPASGPARFAGKTAVLIGASRGLGAAMALELAAEGCRVIGVYSRSAGEADAVTQAGSGLPGSLEMRQADASDPQAVATLKERIKAEFGRLDLLICNAAPSIQPLRIEEACYSRIQAYLQQGFALAAAPLASLLEVVAASQGGVLMISSSAVENPPAIWPHYAALKGAVEGLARAAAAAHPKVRFWIARPNKIETDLINTPMGRLGSEKPDTVARRILTFVAENDAPGAVHICG